MTLEELASVGTTVAAIAACIALCVAAWQLLVSTKALKLNAKAQEASLWLELRKMFAVHDYIHIKLRGGRWDPSNTAQDGGDWPKVEAYMGLFEHCKALFEEEMLAEKIFESIYAYRLGNIVNTQPIREGKLIGLWEDYTLFLKLLDRFSHKVKVPDELWEYIDRARQKEQREASSRKGR